MRAKDRRAFIRISVYHLAKYQPLGGSGAGAVPILASLKDISAGGACLRTETLLPINSLLELKINFPAFEEPVSCKTKVMWVKKIGKRLRYEVGLQFMDLDQETRKRIDAVIKFVREKMSKRTLKDLF
jgi:c-di-GMP-binding flagellar brake protein YcgR